MKRLLLLAVFGIWAAGAALYGPAPVMQAAAPRGQAAEAPMTADGGAVHAVRGANASDVALFLGGYVVLLLLMGVWSRVLARHVQSAAIYKSLWRYNLAMLLARVAVPAWMAVGVFELHWVQAVLRPLPILTRWPIDTPAMLVGVLPALGAWMGLWWSQFPADHALREQTMLLAFDQELQIRPPPNLWAYLASNLRIDLLFLLVPIVLILLLHDCMSLGLWALHWVGPDGSSTGPLSDGAISALDLLPAAVVFVLAPEVLTRVLSTQRLPASPLLDRLQEMTREAGLRYRAILLWLTHGNVGNAAVMGIVPRVRYILLSDLLIESMTDEQVEAVFAHELGHVMHKHLLWYAALVLLLVLATCGPLQSLDDWGAAHLPVWARDGLPTLLVLGGFVLMFGIISRAFERQADVYAARTLDAMALRRGGAADPVEQVEAVDMPPLAPVVGPHGSAVFASALRRAALINNIPTEARNFSHGSISSRISHLRWLSQDPTRTILFEQSVRRLCWLLVGGLVICGVWAGMLAIRGG